MIKNHFLIALRNLKKNLGFSFINITGLAIGIAACLVILLFVKNELSYDRFNKNADQIYRLALEGKFGNNEFNFPATPAPMAEALVRDLPEIQNECRIKNYGFPVIRYKDKVFSEERFFWADSTFFDLFTVDVLKGNPRTALTQPNSVVLTESIAKKYFGNEDPVGKTISADNRKDYLVTAVIKDAPKNSHFHYDFIASLASYDDSRNTQWLSNNFVAYLLVQKGVSPNELEQKINDDIVKYIAPQIEQITGQSLEQQLKQGNKYRYYLQALTDIHLHSHLQGEFEPNGDIAYVYIFLLIAFGILTIACVNFMNLSTARSAGRSKEVGIRKTLGSTFGQLIRQFLSESIIMSTCAVIVALIIVQIFLPTFNNFAGKELSLNFFTEFWAIPVLLLFILFVGLIAGSYPAFFLASFNPVTILSGKMKKGSKGAFLRSTLVILQFSISIILFIGTFVIYNQLNYLQNKNLGFSKDQLVIIHKTDDIGRFMAPFKEELSKTPGVIQVSNSTALPTIDPNFNSQGFKTEGDGSTKILYTFACDYDFAATFKMKMIQGRFFSRDFSTDTLNAVVINEAAAKYLGLKDPVGSTIIQMGVRPEHSQLHVIGVVKDFNFESLHSEIRPLLLFAFNSRGFGRYVTVRVKSNNIEETISNLKSAWGKFAGNQAFEYSFLDKDFAKVYESEQRTGTLFSSFAILAIFIACLGLFGLAAFTAEQRTKEIGIRKVLGASVPSVMVLLMKEFAKWIVISNLIAWPIAYYLMNRWLQDFAYRVNIGVWIFVACGIIALIIASVTVGYQALRAALANPADSLRYE